jgi:Transposase DDE domain
MNSSPGSTTTIPLNSLSADWARFSACHSAAKAHIVFDPDANCPLYLAITPARVNDIAAAQDMPITPGATYCFDLGYYDYAWWAKLDGAGCRIVTRLKANTPLAVLKELAVSTKAADSGIVYDRIGFLPKRQMHNRRNPMGQAVREVGVEIKPGTVLRVLSNDLDASAEEIAAIYKRRWTIELFFRWVKQGLKLRHFYGTSDNAVRIQIAVAMIAFVLIRLACKAQTAIPSMTMFARLIRASVLHRMPLDRMRGHAASPPKTHRQISAQPVLL